MKLRRRLAVPFTLLALPACAGSPAIDAPRAAVAANASTSSPSSSTSVAAAEPLVEPTPTAEPGPAATTSTTSAPTPTTVEPEPEPVASPQRAADGPGLGQTAHASWYGAESGSITANGEPYDGSDLTFAHKTMPFGTLVRFCYEGACVVARCNDRGPFIAGRDFDLSRAAFALIAPLGAGVVAVSWELA